MSGTDLRNLETLKQACLDAKDTAESTENYEAWGTELREFLSYVENSDLETRASEEFHRRIWEDNPVSAVGMGKVSVEAAIKDAAFRKWIADLSLKPLPKSREARGAALGQLFDEIQTEIRKFTDRTPKLKIYRVMAAFFPHDFTTIANAKKLRQLRSALIGRLNDVGPMRHINVLERLAEALGPTGEQAGSVVDRMRLPWLLFTQYVAPSDEDKTDTSGERPGTERLVPLPAARRRRGLGSISGGFSSILNVLEFCRDGVPRDELMNHIKTINPNLKDSSITTTINVLIGELNVLKWDQDLYILTDRGDAVLESGDPNDLMDWLITHLLGVDHVFVMLRDGGPAKTGEMVPKLQKVNSGWTSNWAPTLMINTLRAFGMLQRDKAGLVSLTDAGAQWANQIDWQPEVLENEDDDDSDGEELTQDFGDDVSINMPAFATISTRISQAGYFSEQLIRRLDAGLWAHSRRHFAVLTGLSGSGKTLLARSYGKAISGTDDVNPKQLCTIAVQPGWYDPTALLGYVNPLQGDSYARTPFLEFLLAATREPSLPYTVILDEMNLSRPEQYLAPILSAMETGAPISLHREGELLDGVPPNLRYPSNLVIIGTVNMDETTHGISDKVLDRAFTMEFWDIDLARYPRWGDKARSLDITQEKLARSLLEDLMQCLKPARLHFGWRTVDDVLDYMSRVNINGDSFDVDATLDSVVYAKILPKLRGDDSPRFRAALEQSADVLAKHGLKDCRSKVLELKDDLESTGSARFWR